MSQQTSGLRFDIYERVHLPENTIGMRELNGIELIPEISVAAQGEQAVLSGHLILSGTYTGEDEFRNEGQLTHRIPVEITLPTSRIRNVNDIRVDIENFDVDLLSARSLNVTGVLSLEGIEMATEEAGAWREEEPVTFSHRMEEPAAEAAALPVQPKDVSAHADLPEEAAASPPPGPPDDTERDSGESANATPEEPPALPLEEQTKEKGEIKIAFVGMPSQYEEQPIGVNTMLTMADHAAAALPENAEEAEAAEAAVSHEAKDKLEWKKLFLQKGKDEPVFRKVKMCIVQKEETIETIAERYAKSPRELMLYNRLNDQYLQEGQIVYIP